MVRCSIDEGGVIAQYLSALGTPSRTAKSLVLHEELLCRYMSIARDILPPARDAVDPMNRYIAAMCTGIRG